MLRVVPNMARHVSTALAVLSGSLALLTFASVGHAQLTVTVNAVQDRDVSTRPLTSPYLFSKVECAGAKELDLTIAGIPTGSSVLDFWSGTGCDQVEPRTSTTSSACTYLFSLTSFSTPSAQFWGGEVTVPDLGGCTTTADNTSVNIYILAATSEHTSETITSFAQLATAFDVVAPAPPTGVTGGSGSSAVPVSWTGTTGTVNGYRVYVGSVTSSAEGGACSAGGLVAGEAPPASATLAATASGTAGSVNLNLATLGLAIGDSVSVGVVARDTALNEGVLSNLSCVTRVETCGYLCQRGGTISTCSAVPGARRAGGVVGAALAGLMLVGLVMRVRRSRSVR